MTTAPTRVSAYNSLFANVYERAFLIARANCVMSPLVTPYTDSNGTEQRIFSQREQATAQHVNESDDFQSPDRMGKSSIATLTPHEAMSQTEITDRAVRQDATVITDKADEMGMAMAQLIDTDLLSTFTSLNGGEGATIGGAGITATLGHFFAAQAQLKRKNIAGRFNVVIHPYVAQVLSTSVNLTKNLASTPDSIKEGLAEDMWLGSLQNMDFYVSNNIVIDGSGDSVGAMFTAEALALDTRVAPHGLPTEYDSSARSTEFNMYADYGYGVRRANYGVPLQFDTPVPTS